MIHESGKNNGNLLWRYIRSYPLLLAVVTLTGIVYNVGMLAGPYFEGLLAQKLCDIFAGTATVSSMVILAVIYMASILLVQFIRFLKRLYVRKYGNRISLRLKQAVYTGLLKIRPGQDTATVQGSGAVMTRAIQDAETCAEGIRKFLTEIFDTGVVMICYIVMLFSYDIRLSLIAILFPPLAYIIAARLGKPVTKSAAKAREEAGSLNAATLDRVQNATTYRIFGVESIRNAIYEQRLASYEHASMVSGVLESSMQPLYQVIAMLGVIFILWLGAKNVMNTGTAVWNIAAFTTYLSCYLKLCKKASKSAKLFNAVQKAKVSWDRIKKFVSDGSCADEEKEPGETVNIRAQRQKGKIDALTVEGLSCWYEDENEPVLKNITLNGSIGEIVGVTGPVACGKSTLGIALLNEGNIHCSGTAKLFGHDLDNLNLKGLISYLGHDPELMSGTIRENILIGREYSEERFSKILSVCELHRDIDSMEKGIETEIGEGGIQLSGGQQARVALARALYEPRPIIILDDPFSALDAATEDAIMESLKENCTDSLILLISHRLEQFNKTDHVLYLDEEGNGIFDTHNGLLSRVPAYQALCELQKGGKQE